MSEENDLTTDSIPSPPRDEMIKDDQIPKVKATKKPKSVFAKPKKTPTAVASVINISNSKQIHIGSNYNYYISNKAGTAEKSSAAEEYIVTEAIQRLFSSNVAVDRNDLMSLAPHINEEWRCTARALNYSEGQISQFYEDYSRTGIEEVIYQLLLDWIQNEADEATVGKLSKTLWDTNQQDTVKRWAKNFAK